MLLKVDFAILTALDTVADQILPAVQRAEAEGRRASPGGSAGGCGGAASPMPTRADESTAVGVLHGLIDSIVNDRSNSTTDDQRRVLADVLERFSHRTLEHSADLSLDDFRLSAATMVDHPVQTSDCWMAVLLMLRTLIEEVRQLRTTDSRKPIYQMDKPIWSVEELAEFENITPQRVRQRVSEYRKQYGKDPMWVRRLPGRVRGFKVHFPSYFQTNPSKPKRVVQ